MRNKYNEYVEHKKYAAEENKKITNFELDKK
jgi:hypothetical protein